MRPDEHKARDSRRYQQKKKQAGDTSAAEIALARRQKNAAARDRGVGISAIRRRNGEYEEVTEEEKEERRRQQAKYSKRTKLSTNADRYEEIDEVEEMKRDAEMGIDRETTDLVSMLEDSSSAAQLEDTGSALFKFKGEKLLEDNSMLQQQRSNMFELDFSALNASLNSLEASTLLRMDDGLDMELLENALNEEPIVVDKPIVPAFTKNAKGYILFKSNQYQQPPKANYRVSERDGIYLRNDASAKTSGMENATLTKAADLPTPTEPKENSAPISSTVNKQSVTKDEDNDDLDDLNDLLGLDQPNKTNAKITTAIESTDSSKSSASPSFKKPITKSLPKPGQIKKSTQQVPSPSTNAVSKDDETWLDELLG